MFGPRRYVAVLAVLVVGILSPAPGAGEIAIVHTGVQCVVADRFPRLEAEVPAGAEIARARIHFRPEPSKFWYSVEMARTGQALVGRLPRPKKSLPSFRYYIEVTDPGFATSRTAEYAPVVAGNAAECADKLQAATETTAVVALLPTSGAPPIPAGFAPSGVTTAASGGAAGAAASGGGGIGTTTVIVGGAVVAAGAAVAVTMGGGNDGDSGGSGGDGGSGGSGGNGGTGGAPGGTPGGNPGSAPGGGPAGGTGYDVFFEPSPPGIDVSPCASSRLIWCCQAITTGPDGTFAETWAPNEPNTLRITGRVTATTFEATLTCVSGGPSGSINATGATDLYRGSFDFRGSRGTVRVQRR